MDISSNALDLIQTAEGLRLNAYRDPVGIATIGYGTIAYPNGRKVEMDDSISAGEASAFLKFDCDQMAKGVADATQGAPLNQNQFDALMSFSYNLGVGALLESTLLKKLKALDFAGAADEFPNWNKGFVNGVKVVLDGLTARREKERALFLKTDAPGVPLPAPQSNAEQAVAAKGFNQGGANLLVAYDSTGAAVEILAFSDSSPLTIIAALKTYPNLAAFDFAKTGDKVPDSVRLAFSGLSQAISKAVKPPDLTKNLLVVGMEDGENPPGDDIRNMQGRLTDLGYYAGPIDAVFNLLTDRAVRQFQADYFGRSQADGKVGPITWKKLWGDFKPAKPAPGAPSSTPAPGRNYLTLTRTDAKDEFGSFILTLAYFRDGVFVSSLGVCSGQPRKQMFRKGVDSPAQSMEPLPEGKWSIGDVEWCGGKDNYEGAVWNSGLGPAKIELGYLGPGTTARAGIEMHIDWNRATAPGTAGCVGLLNVADFKTLVGWLRDTNPRTLYVDWGLGSCPAP